MSIFDFDFLARAVAIIDFSTLISTLVHGFFSLTPFNRMGRLLFLCDPVTTLNSLPRRRLAYLSFPSPTFSLHLFGILFPNNLFPSPSSGNSAAIAFPLLTASRHGPAPKFSSIYPASFYEAISVTPSVSYILVTPVKTGGMLRGELPTSHRLSVNTLAGSIVLPPSAIISLCLSSCHSFQIHNFSTKLLRRRYESG